ncbi:MAG TPA: dihydrofolate reductase family protein [Gemmatimonadales bacterium]|jgi:dihydrofolate reductase|nr:dihydrofolate reductase family protein [Gemmatimonadales bacterium]
MSKLRFNITMSLDGYVAGPHQSVKHPLGVGGEHLHDWALKLKTFRELHGDGGGGETGVNDDIVRETFDNIGATIMGRNMFGGGPGPWGIEPWNGWWGKNPPFHTPVFVLTHHMRAPLEMEGGTRFIFVTDGIETALAQAKKAAGNRDVTLGGGASVAQQYLAAGLIDEMELHVVPLLLGGGERLFDRVDGGRVKLEPVRTVEGPGVVHLKYRVVK